MINENKNNEDNLSSSKAVVDWSKALLVLGAQDGEMREIEKVAKSLGIKYAHAAKAGIRTDSSKAYDADCIGILGADGRFKTMVLEPSRQVVFVECTVNGRTPRLRIDHHNPGDPGYDAPPEFYMKGSSLGQALALWGKDPTDDQRLLAAADHCLTAAYQGLCPGVDPGELLFMRAAWQGLMTRRAMGETMISIMDAAKEVKKRFNVSKNASIFTDLTKMPRDLAEGAAYAGIAVIYRGMSPSGEMKEMIKGGSPDEIQVFMDEHKKSGRKVYGNPHRGYAGAYLDRHNEDKKG